MAGFHKTQDSWEWKQEAAHEKWEHRQVPLYSGRGNYGQEDVFKARTVRLRAHQPKAKIHSFIIIAFELYIAASCCKQLSKSSSCRPQSLPVRVYQLDQSRSEYVAMKSEHEAEVHQLHRSGLGFSICKVPFQQ